MEWIYLIAAIFFEVAGTTSMKFSDGFTKPIPSLLMVVFYVLCFGTFALAVKRLDISTSYAIWAGLGTAIIATIGILWLHEPINALKLVSIALIVIGVVGINLSGAH